MFVSATCADRIVPIGKLIANLNRSVNHFDRSPGIVLLLKDNRLPDGVMFAISTNYRSPKPVRVQVWRPTNTPSTYKLVWEHRYEPIPAPGHLQHVSYLSVTVTSTTVVLNLYRYNPFKTVPAVQTVSSCLYRPIAGLYMH